MLQFHINNKQQVTEKCIHKASTFFFGLPLNACFGTKLMCLVLSDWYDCKESIKHKDSTEGVYNLLQIFLPLF